MPSCQENKLLSTATLLSQVRQGNPRATEALCAAYLPILTRWAHGRLPNYARQMLETNDLVQVTLIRALNNIHHIKVEREGAFIAYLRRIMLNAIRDEIRKAYRQPVCEELVEDLPLGEPSPVEQAIGREVVAGYEKALAQLPEAQREAVMLRIEFGFSFPEIAAATQSPSANAARMMVSRGSGAVGRGHVMKKDHLKIAQDIADRANVNWAAARRRPLGPQFTTDCRYRRGL